MDRMNKTCPTCPFLAINKGKPTPTDFKCVEHNETDWYSQENIDGIWYVMRKDPISFLSCHTTDPDYYGKDEKNISACVGAALCVYMHIKIFEKVGPVYTDYIKAVGNDVAMYKNVMGEKALAIVIGKTSPLWGGMSLPNSLKLDLDVMRWPSGFEKTVALFKKIIK